jgi:hypothetical protein
MRFCAARWLILTGNVPAYDASKWGRSGDKRMLDIIALPIEERIKAVYGGNGGNGHEPVKTETIAEKEAQAS